MDGEDKRYAVISVDRFKDMFGVEHELDGVSGRLSRNNRFYPYSFLDKIISDHFIGEGKIAIPLDDCRDSNLKNKL